MDGSRRSHEVCVNRSNERNVSRNGLEVWDHPIDHPHLATMSTASYSCQPYWTKGSSWTLAFELLSRPWSKSSKSMAYLAWFGIPQCGPFTLPCHGHRQNFRSLTAFVTSSKVIVDLFPPLSSNPYSIQLKKWGPWTRQHKQLLP